MSDDDVSARAKDAALEILRRVGQCATTKERLREFKRSMQLLPVEIRESVGTLFTWQEGLLMDQQRPTTLARRDRIGLAVSGAVFLLLLLGIAVSIPNPTKFQERVFVIVLAIAAGAAGAFLPGAIAVEGKRPSVAVRATGAIGFAVFILLFYRFLI